MYNGGGVHEVVLVTESNGRVASRVWEFEVVSDMQDQVRSDWSVQLNADHWQVMSDQGWSQLRWVLYDTSGRRISQGDAGEGHTFSVDCPMSLGAYRLVIQQKGARNSVLSLVYSIH